jgi:hypothetical protein
MLEIHTLGQKIMKSLARKSFVVFQDDVGNRRLTSERNEITDETNINRG